MVSVQEPESTMNHDQAPCPIGQVIETLRGKAFLQGDEQLRGSPLLPERMRGKKTGWRRGWPAL